MEDVYIDFENNQAPAMNDTTMNQLQKLIKQEILQKLQLTFPVGSTYVTQNNTNPNTILGFGTWERLKGKVTVGLDENDTDFNSIKKTGGSKTVAHTHSTANHTLTKNEIPTHNHNFVTASGTAYTSIATMRNNGSHDISQGSGSRSYDNMSISNAGGGQPHNHGNTGSASVKVVQPYEVVGYLWIRRS